tara:strand:- start:1199 stop:1459 length:261 start_codon:yes stop_codon:yes gene_type:complete
MTKEYNRNSDIWCGRIPELCGYGLTVYANSKKEVRETLKTEFHKLRKIYNFHNQDYYTFENAMDYFGGDIFQVKLNRRYDDLNREY